jgi:hypothetical protein
MAAIATAIIEPEIRPPGSDPHKNKPPPAAPIASVSTTATFDELKMDGDAEADF